MNLLVSKWQRHSHLLSFNSLKTYWCTSSYGPFMSLGPFKCCTLELKVSTVCNYCPSSHHQPSTHDGMWIWTLFADISMRLESNLASISKNRNKPRQACANCQLFAHRLLGVHSSSELLTQIPLTRPEPWCHVKLTVPTEGWRSRSGWRFVLFALCTCTCRSYFCRHSLSQVKLKVELVKF